MGINSGKFCEFCPISKKLVLAKIILKIQIREIYKFWFPRKSSFLIVETKSLVSFVRTFFSPTLTLEE